MDIPLVIIAYETYTFIKQMVDQADKYFKTIIILDNNSQYPLLHEYYNELEAKDPNKYKIHRLDVNHGHLIYQMGIVPLPPVYCLTDPDIGLNENIPDTFITDLYNLSIRLGAYKVGFAIELDVNAFIKENGFNTMQVNAQARFWKRCIGHINETDPIYRSAVDTTFCLINNNYRTGNGWAQGKHVRVAGKYTCKHLPWYEGYIAKHMPIEEYNYWKKGNPSSSFLQYNLAINPDAKDS